MQIIFVSDYAVQLDVSLLRFPWQQILHLIIELLDTECAPKKFAKKICHYKSAILDFFLGA